MSGKWPLGFSLLVYFNEGRGRRSKTKRRRKPKGVKISVLSHSSEGTWTHTKWFPDSLRHGASVTRLGDFYKFLATNCLTKVAQMCWWLFGLFLIMSLFSKKCVATFWAIFGGKLDNFLFFHLVTLHGALYLVEGYNNQKDGIYGAHIQQHFLPISKQNTKSIGIYKVSFLKKYSGSHKMV